MGWVSLLVDLWSPSEPEILHFPTASHISILTTVNSGVDIQERLEMEIVA